MARQVAEDLIVEFRERKLDAVYLLYNQFKSAMTQAITFTQLLPIVAPPAEEKPAPGGFIEPEHLYEPSRPHCSSTSFPGNSPCRSGAPCWNPRRRNTAPA